MTPTRMSRIQEKRELASLNDRLAAYIERNQQLENENQSLVKQVNKILDKFGDHNHKPIGMSCAWLNILLVFVQVSHSEETLQRNVTRIQSSYDKELTDARKVVDETAKEKAKLQMDHAQLRKDYDDVKSK